MLDGAVLWYVRRKFPSVCHMTTNDLESLLNGTSTYEEKDIASQKIYDRRNPVVIVDCRRKDEFEVSHIPNSKHLHFQTNAESLLAFLAEESDKHVNIDSVKEELNVVCYCSLGYRSSMLVERIDKLTKTNPLLSSKNIKVWNLEGSIFKWANENKQMKDLNDKPTKFAHPFSYTFCMFLQRDYWKWTADAKEDI